VTSLRVGTLRYRLRPLRTGGPVPQRGTLVATMPQGYIFVIGTARSFVRDLGPVASRG
jgi:hypothetical protein